MTTTATFPVIGFLWLKPKPQQTETIATNPHEDGRRAYLSDMIAAECCVGEFGMQALMGLFPKDF